MADDKNKASASADPTAAGSAGASSAESTAKEKKPQIMIRDSRGREWPHVKTVRDGKGIVWDYYDETRIVPTKKGMPPESAVLRKRVARLDTIPAPDGHGKTVEIDY